MNYKRIRLVLLGLASWLGASFGGFAILYYPATHRSLPFAILLGLLLGATMLIAVFTIGALVCLVAQEGWAWLHGGNDD